MIDILIRNGRIADGTGSASYVADVAVQDGKITQIAPHIMEPASQVLDATGLWVTPGFIDCHSHSDDRVFFGTDSYNFLEQGVTTQITGNCGMSPAPYYDGCLAGLKKKVGDPAFCQIRRQAQTMGTFLEMADTRSVGTNMAFFVGHCNLRGRAMGFDPRKPTASQLGQMQDQIREAMEAGCLGVSSGLVYAPSVYGDTEELIALAKTVALYGGIYATHIRGEASRVVEAVKEAIQIGEQAGVQVHISHLKVIGKDRVGVAQQLLQMMDDANRRGVKVYADQYPYTASSAQLRALIPPQFHEGGMEKLLERLQDRQIRKTIEETAYRQTDPYESGIRSAGWDGIQLGWLPQMPAFSCRRLGELAREQNKRPMDLLCEILLAHNGTGQGIYHSQNEENMLQILAHPMVFAGTDSADFPDERIAPEQVGGRHPRGVAGMVRRLELQRDLGICTPEEAIRRMTGAPAAAFGLEKRGRIQKGFYGDIVVLDHPALRANNSYQNPCIPNSGIRYVLVNGTLVVENGLFNGQRAGSILRKT